MGGRLLLICIKAGILVCQPTSTIKPSKLQHSAEKIIKSLLPNKKLILKGIIKIIRDIKISFQGEIEDNKARHLCGFFYKNHLFPA